MNQKKLILIIVLILLILAIAIAVYFLFLKPEPISAPKGDDSTQEDPEDQSSDTPSAPSPDFHPASSATPEEAEHGQVKNLALSFTERFGSFSNQANYQNLEELKDLMTPAMVAWTNNFITESKAKDLTNAPYHAFITNALSFEEDNYSFYSDKAEFIVKCRRQESSGSPDNSSVYFQSIKITLLKQQDIWLVNSAEWQK